MSKKIEQLSYLYFRKWLKFCYEYLETHDSVTVSVSKFRLIKLIIGSDH